jgi:hypothetical protein
MSDNGNIFRFSSRSSINQFEVYHCWSTTTRHNKFHYTLGIFIITEVHLYLILLWTSIEHSAKGFYKQQNISYIIYSKQTLNLWYRSIKRTIYHGRLLFWEFLFKISVAERITCDEIYILKLVRNKKTTLTSIIWSGPGKLTCRVG